MKKQLSVLLVASLFAMTTGFAAPNYKYNGGAQNPVYQQNYYPAPIKPTAYNSTLKGRVVTVPSGQKMSAFVSTPISSAYTTVGQTIQVSLGSDFCYNGNMIAPAGSTVYGTVIESSKAKHGSMNGKLCVRFNQIITPYGLQIPISAIIKTTDNSGVLVGGTKADVAKDYAKDTVSGAALGAVSGLVFGALAGGNVGRGAALGTAVGAGGGLLKSGFDKGNDVEIPAGASLDLVLTQPVTVTPSSYDYEN